MDFPTYPRTFYVEFVVAGEDPSVSFEPSDEPFYLVSFLVGLPVVCPGLFAVALGWDDRGVVEVEGQLACLVPFVGPIRDQEPAFGLGTDPLEECPPVWGVVVLSGGRVCPSRQPPHPD